MVLLGSEGAYHQTISGVAVDTEATRLMVANDPTGVFSTGGSEGIVTPGETLPLALSIDTGVGADGSSRELVSVDVRFTAVGLDGAEEYDLEFLNPAQVLVNGESRQVYDLSFAVPDMWQGADSRRVVSSYVATLSDGTQIESSYDDVVLFWVPGISQSIQTLAALHAEVCASRPQGASSADVAGIWHLLGNCGYSAASPDARYLNGIREHCEEAVFSTLASTWGFMGLELYSSTVSSSRYAPDDNVWIGSRVRGLAPAPRRCLRPPTESTLSASRCRDDLSPTSACVASVDSCVCGLDVTLADQTKTQYNYLTLYPDERVLAGTELYNAGQSLYRTNELTRSCSYKWRLNRIAEKLGAVLQDTGGQSCSAPTVFEARELLFVEDSP